MDFEKVKSDIVYFVEKVLGFELMHWQKVLLKEFEKGFKKDRFIEFKEQKK